MKVIVKVVGLVCCLVLPATVPLAAQQAQDGYSRSISLAQGYVQERRFEDAIAMFRKAYDAKPDPSVLAQMGNAFMALGMSTEAEDVFNQVLAQGAEIKLAALHRHASGNRCLGMLFISHKQVRWAGPKDSFSVDPKEIGKIENPEFPWKGGAVPGLRMRAQNRKWFLEYLIYDVGQYEMNLNGEAVYYGDDLQKAEKATGLIIRLMGKASSSVPSTAISSQQSLPSSGAAARSAVTNANTADRPSQVPEPAKPASADASVQLKEGQTPEEVEQNLGKPQDTITVKDNLIYVYPTVKVIFERRKLVDVQYPENKNPK